MTLLVTVFKSDEKCEDSILNQASIRNYIDISCLYKYRSGMIDTLATLSLVSKVFHLLLIISLKIGKNAEF